MRILIVDDSSDKISLIRGLIQGAGGADSIVVAETGLAAREQLSSSQFDVLLVDIALPLRLGDTPDPKGGFNLLIELEKSTRLRKPANVIALTGYPELRAEFEQRFNDGMWAIDLCDPADSGWRDRLVAKLSYLRRSVMEASERRFDRDVCIITALKEPELDAVRRLPYGFGTAQAFDATTFRYSGTLTIGAREFSVDAVSAPRMGMVAAATLTSKIIYQLKPRIVIMVGICAGVRGETELGDVVVADPAWDWQMGKYTVESFQMQPDQIGCPLEVSQRFSALKDARQEILRIMDAYSGDKPSSFSDVKIGPMASGSAVIASADQASSIVLQNRKLLAFDMEMYGVLSAVRDSAGPRPLAFGIKAVCDHADHYKNDKYQAYAAHMSAGITDLFLRRYLTDFI